MLDDALSTELPPDLSGPAEARRFVVAHTLDVPRQVRDDAALLVSELVTNAVRYGRPPIQLFLQVDGNEVAVAVDDQGDGVPAPSEQVPEPDQPGGRGLHIVAAVAGEWGVVPSGAGKRVWFRLES